MTIDIKVLPICNLLLEKIQIALLGLKPSQLAPFLYLYVCI